MTTVFGAKTHLPFPVEASCLEYPTNDSWSILREKNPDLPTEALLFVVGTVLFAGGRLSLGRLF